MPPYHNETCGCAECRNYGQVYNPLAIHNLAHIPPSPSDMELISQIPTSAQAKQRRIAWKQVEESWSKILRVAATARKEFRKSGKHCSLYFPA